MNNTQWPSITLRSRRSAYITRPDTQPRLASTPPCSARLHVSTSPSPRPLLLWYYMQVLSLDILTTYPCFHPSTPGSLPSLQPLHLTERQAFVCHLTGLPCAAGATNLCLYAKYLFEAPAFPRARMGSVESCPRPLHDAIRDVAPSLRLTTNSESEPHHYCGPLAAASGSSHAALLDVSFLDAIGTPQIAITWELVPIPCFR